MKRLTGKQVRYLRGLGHHLQPVVLIGKEALTPSLLAAAEEALAHHELIKVKLQEGCLLDRREAAETLAKSLGAEVAQVLGRTFLLYRPADEPTIQLP